ncbi:MAG TPA: large conductance mechanosensitive channel protein MscL [Gemmatimonadales bacterium]|nr:large conductance mechanosensitive channel protein MscL [Gemmatimonadales bacterium]
MLSEFKKFMMRGNVLDLAVGIIIGAAFGTVVTSLVNDILMPPIGLVLGQVDFSNLFLVLKDGVEAPGPYATVAAAKDAGAVTLNYGLFINSLVSFLIVGFAVFLVVRAANRLQGPTPAAAPATKNCPECAMPIPIGARRCPHCTSEVVRAA